MIELVSVNGIMQSTYAYIVQDTSIIFRVAPPPMAEVNVSIQGTNITYTGNGTNCVFNLPSDIRLEMEFKQFMHQAWLNRHNPTVKDQLEKLKVVMELVR